MDIPKRKALGRLSVFRLQGLFYLTKTFLTPLYSSRLILKCNPLSMIEPNLNVQLTRPFTSDILVKQCGHSSVVERHLAKVNVARSNRVARFLKIIGCRLSWT
jgi:hypothetical protein